MDEEFDRGADILTDEILDKHLGGGPATAVSDDPPDPAADDISPDDLASDTSDEDPEEEFDDTEMDEDGEDEPDDELDDDLDDEDLDDDFDEDDDLEEDDDEDDEEDVLDGHVTKEDHERIKNDPSLQKVHKEMQRAFTKKSQELADERREVDTLRDRHERLEATLSTPQGMANYLASMIQQRPDVVGAAFEAVATGDAALDFLVEVGLHDAEVFERAYDRVHELQTDEDERNRHVRDRERAAKDRDIKNREQRLRRQTFDRAVSRIQGIAEREADRLGMDKDGLETVNDRLRDEIRKHVQEDGSIGLDRKEIRSIAKAVKKEIDRVEERVRARLERKRTSQSQRETRRKAQQAKGRKRVPPKGKGSRAPKTESYKPPEGADPLDSFIDHRLETL